MCVWLLFVLKSKLPKSLNAKAVDKPIDGAIDDLPMKSLQQKYNKNEI